MAGTADKDYFLDDEGNVTTDQEKAATLLIRGGQEIPKEMADKYGDALGGKVAQTEAKEAKAEKAESKKEAKLAEPSENKKAKPSKNKGAK